MLSFRVSRSYDDLKSFFNRPQLSSIIVYQHDSDEDVSRTHVHALFTDTQSPSIDTLKRWIKSDLAVDQFPKSDWSFKNGCDLNFIVYMSKGVLDPVQSSLSEEVIRGYKSQWVDKPLTKTGTEVTSYTLSEELAKWIDSTEVSYNHSTGMWQAHDVDERDIIRQCIKIHNKYRKGFCDFSLVRVIQTAYGLCSKQRWKDALVEKVFDKLSPYKL